MKTRDIRKIILFGPWPPPYGGVSVHMKDLYENLRHAGSSVSILAFGDFTTVNNVKKFEFLPLHKYLWALAKTLLVASSHDIVHKHSVLTAYPSGHEKHIQVFRNFIKYKKIKWVETIHDETLISRYPTFSKETKSRFPVYLSEAFKIITVNDKLKDFLISIGISKNKIEVISSLLPVQPPPAKVKMPLETEKFINTHHPVISTSGAFSPLYDIKTIVQAFIDILHSFPEAGLIIIQSGFTKDEVYERQILTLASQRTDSILRVKDIERENVLQIMKASDLFIRGVKEESFGISKIEAIFMGTPVISTPAGETKFMDLYDFGNADRLAEITAAVLSKGKQHNNEAQVFYRKLADENFRRIADIYRNAASA